MIFKISLKGNWRETTSRQLFFCQGKRRRLTLLSSGMVILIYLILAVGAPFISPYSYFSQNLVDANLPPGIAHWLGTDSLGRDLFTRLLYGARISLTVAAFVVLINLSIGVLYGGISGFLGGLADRIMMGLVEVLWGIPPLLIVVLLAVLLEPGLKNVFFAIGLVFWLPMARIVRGQVLQVKHNDYVLAARVMGIGWRRLLFKYILLNCLGPILVAATLAIPEAIFVEAFLSFMGLGVRVPMASWGVLMADGLLTFQSNPTCWLAPGLALTVIILAFNFLGDALQECFSEQGRSFVNGEIT